MAKTKIAATRHVAAISKVVSIAIIIDYNRFNQKSKAKISEMVGGEPQC